MLVYLSEVFCQPWGATAHTNFFDMTDKKENAALNQWIQDFETEIPTMKEVMWDMFHLAISNPTFNELESKEKATFSFMFKTNLELLETIKLKEHAIG